MNVLPRLQISGIFRYTKNLIYSENFHHLTSIFVNSFHQDLGSLAKLVEEDNAASKTPVLVIAYAGTPLTGHVDDIDAINDLCRENNMWLHIEG